MIQISSKYFYLPLCKPQSAPVSTLTDLDWKYFFELSFFCKMLWEGLNQYFGKYLPYNTFFCKEKNLPFQKYKLFLDT